MTRLTTAALMAGLLVAAAPTLAANYNGITFSELQYVFQSAGLSVSNVSKSPDAQVLSVGGGGTFVWVTDCDPAGRCAEINVFRNYSNVRPSLQRVNEWNNTKKIPEASVNPDGTLHMEMWLSMIGATDTNIIDSYKWFERYAADASFWTGS